ncbi:polar amino acid transport system permease protein [Agrobacterium tumefaciens]|uniref:Polar amino acid transport system permease protein n=1 Tax=Agrobacterium radiobacter TaxID=362 RepID=A0ABR6JCT0_AGRRD|nr:amino acid ABC transporter permease [Agrobacterium radiobacter]MBB4320449.1 polar amino acid transport system permease protein [Agrobacterium radiobacter]MBB4337114.1 polar amino acid transport system permease protein [Agrobacterium radiobacter]MBB4492638.1 polar amino acid transport system permease protein [Agrobacterium radiobacter]MBB4497536.1 polar amino acid transport system permease protein [Agrobacterium radiobacter]MBB4502553.1 polar amino acid transport system permease protein [Agr
MDFQLVARIAPFIAEAALVTVELTILSLALGLVVAVIVAAGRFSRTLPIRWLATAYVSIMRGTPLLVQLFIVYFGGPQFGLELTPFFAGALTMGFNIGAYMSEGIKGAILAIDKGQTEASRSLGFDRLDTLRLFVLPQAAPLMIRSLGVNTVILSKSTALVSTIGVVELTYSAQRFVTSTYKPFEVFAEAGAAYIAIVAVISLIVRGVENRFSFSKESRI